MADLALIDTFERCAIDPERFKHADHMRLAWSYLRQMPLPEALIKMRDGLKRLTEFLGKPDRYHETVTFAYVMLIQERMASGEEAQTWDTFLGSNQDLLASGQSILDQFYSSEKLSSPLARRTFVWPDRMFR